MFNIVTDSSADIPLSWLTRGDIKFVPLKVYIKGVEYTSKRSTFQEDICKYVLKYKGKEQLPIFKALGPRTEPPSVEDFIKIYEEVSEPIISIHLSSKISETFENAKKAAEQVGKEIYVVDSGTVSAGLGILVWHLMNIRDTGADVKEAIRKIEKVKTRIKVGVGIYHPEIVDISERLSFDREVSGFTLAEFEEGKLKVINEFDDFEEVIDKMAETVNDLGPEMTVVSHFCNPKAAQELSMKIIYPSEIAEIDLAVSIHIGPRAVAIGLIRCC